MSVGHDIHLIWVVIAPLDFQTDTNREAASAWSSRFRSLNRWIQIDDRVEGTGREPSACQRSATSSIRIEHCSYAADVLHPRQIQGGLALQLVVDHDEALESLGDLDTATFGFTIERRPLLAVTSEAACARRNACTTEIASRARSQAGLHLPCQHASVSDPPSSLEKWRDAGG